MCIGFASPDSFIDQSIEKVGSLMPETRQIDTTRHSQSRSSNHFWVNIGKTDSTLLCDRIIIIFQPICSIARHSSLAAIESPRNLMLSKIMDQS
jgi:hypothetical protein